ncbi:hypothetical protein DRO97_00665 [Archaeoglobales archaeon]|nr:MAG: hypothetical protein DRO97_00665 [Archaeoglobales archaeon]
MKLKKPPQITTLPISTFILHKDRYKIDPTYQREAGTWTRSDEQYLIDTILRGYGMPPIFLHEKDGIEFIVDGQQRLNTIWKFRGDELPLSPKYSEDIINDEKNKQKNRKPAYYYSELHKDWQDRFDSYPLPIIYLKDYNDEEIRDLFRRLQHGKPLNPGEILNAYPGDIVLTMRKLADHEFFREIVDIKAKRYRHYYIAAQLLFLESEGIKDISPYYIYEFFEKNKNLSTNSKVYSRVNKVLNYLSEVFQNRTPELRKPGWIITVYLLTAHLLENYSMDAQKVNLKTFFTEFYQAVISSSASGDQELIDFNLAISKGTTSQRNIKLRYEVILKRFLDRFNPMRLDENRLFTNDQKIAIFRRDKETCQVCGKKLIFGDLNTHFHHKDKYIEGGKTEIENGLLVCRDCHLNKIHGSNTNLLIFFYYCH